MKKIFSTIITAALIFPAFVARAQSITLTDPLKLEGDAFELYGRLIRGFTFIIGATALAFFVMGGFWWLTSGGNEEKIKKGRDTLLWATIGMAAILGSYFLLSYIIKVLTGTLGVPSQ